MYVLTSNFIKGCLMMILFGLFVIQGQILIRDIFLLCRCFYSILHEVLLIPTITCGIFIIENKSELFESCHFNCLWHLGVWNFGVIRGTKSPWKKKEFLKLRERKEKGEGAPGIIQRQSDLRARCIYLTLKNNQKLNGGNIYGIPERIGGLILE